MTYGPVKVFSGQIASGASTLTSVDLTKSWSRVYVQLPTMSTATQIDIYGSYDGSTYVPIYERVNTAPVQYQTMTISNLVGTNGGIAQLSNHAQYLQVRCTGVVSGGVALQFICVD